MEAAWACAVDRASDMAGSAKRFFLSFRRPPPLPYPGPKPALRTSALQLPPPPHFRTALPLPPPHLRTSLPPPPPHLRTAAAAATAPPLRSAAAAAARLRSSSTPAPPRDFEKLYGEQSHRREGAATGAGAAATQPRMEAAWACAVDRATDMAGSAKRFFLSFRRPPSLPHPDPNPIDILKRLQRQAFYDIMQLRERQEKVERVLTLFKSSKSGPFAEESTRVKGLISFAGALALKNKDAAPDSSEANSGISSQFTFQTNVRKKDSLLAELVTDSRCLSQESDLIGSPLVLSKVMYLANINDYLSVAAVPVGARCDDFSTDPSLREGHWLASFHSSLRPPLLLKRHKYAAGLILRSQNFAASLAELISAAGKNSGGASSIFTGFGQISCQMRDEIKLTLSGAWHGPCLISRKRKPTAGGCIDFELKIDEDSMVGAWIEVKKSNPRLLKWAITLSDTPEDDLGWGVSLRRGIEGAPKRIQLEGFLNLHLGKKATLQPGVVLNLDGRRCAPAVVFQSSWFL